jgi:precorrin-3B synthase
VLSVWSADDGGLARVRLPGGRVSTAGLRVLAAAAEQLGNGELELTVRGNLQVRGLAAGAERDLADRLRAVGLLPSDSHDRVRNIVASPATGLLGPDVSTVVRELDAALIADPLLAGLPGRFLFAVDDGTADVSALGPDVGLFRADDTDDGYALLLGGTAPGLRPAAGHAVAAAICAARAFLTLRQRDGSAAWRLAELPDGPARVAAAVRAAVPTGSSCPDLPANALDRPRMLPAGVLATRDGRAAVLIGVPHRRLTAAAVAELAGLAGLGSATEIRVTPWRSLLVPELDPAGLAAVLSWARAHRLEVGAR